MEFKLPTREECRKIVEKSEAFFVTETEVEGYRVEMYSYRLASISDFVENNAFELRGITFAQNEQGEWERHILMNKFFNVNETEIILVELKNKEGKIIYKGLEGTKEYNAARRKVIIEKYGSYNKDIKNNIKDQSKTKKISWMYEDIKDKKIVRIQDKLDGSVISFVKLPNGNIRAKSKMSFTSEQAIMAQEILNNKPILLEELDKMSRKGLTPIFELCSPANQIILEYEDTELVLLQIRDDKGNYLGQKDLEWYSNVSCVKLADELLVNVQIANNKVKLKELPNKINFSELDYLLDAKEDTENIEGWIVTFEDGQMAKIKTDWYLHLHGLIGPDAFRENLLVESIMEDTIDDVISQLSPGTKKDRIIELTEKVQHEFNHLVVSYENLKDEFYANYGTNNIKDFAIKYSKSHDLFGYVMRGIKLTNLEKDWEQMAEKHVKEYILKQTNSLGKAKEWIDNKANFKEK